MFPVTYHWPWVQVVKLHAVVPAGSAAAGPGLLASGTTSAVKAAISRMARLIPNSVRSLAAPGKGGGDAAEFRLGSRYRSRQSSAHALCTGIFRALCLWRSVGFPNDALTASEPPSTFAACADSPG